MKLKIFVFILPINFLKILKLKEVVLFLTSMLYLSCSTNKEKVLFDEFQSRIRSFENNYQIGDTISSMSDSLWGITDFIDTSYILKFSLIDTTFKTEDYNKIKFLKDYHCSFIGQYEKEKITLLLTYSIKVWAGDGNPIITASTFSEDGRLLDILRIDLESIKDAFYQPTTFFTVNENLDITTILLVNEYEERDEKFILTDSSSILKEYTIDNEGKFKRKKLN